VSEQGCTGFLVFGVASLVGTIAAFFVVMNVWPSAGDPYVGGAAAATGLVVAVVSGLVFATIATAVAMRFMRRR
jgi:membrane associated rhomboid family serine protease